MLNLNARITFDKEVFFCLGHDQELERPRIRIVTCPSEFDRIDENTFAKRWFEIRRRRNFDYLLIAKLYRAIAFVQMDEISLGITQHLHLDVTRIRDPFLKKQRGVSECCVRLALTALERIRHFRFLLDKTHAASAATSRRLEHDGIAYLPR